MKQLTSFKPTGIIPATITPFYQDESINFEALRKIIRYQLDGGVHGIFVIGTTGEFYAMTLDQKRAIIETTMEEVNGQVPVYAGTGGISTSEIIALDRMAEDCGVDAVSILTPMFISPSQDDLYEHYRIIASETNLPVILYNNVPKTGVNIAVETVRRLSEINNIIGIKDSSGNFDLTSEYIRVTRDNPEFHILQGRDTNILAGLTYGATGAIAATANVAPRLVVDIYEKFMSGDSEGALKAQFTLAPLRMAFTLGTFPAVIKESLHMLGIDAGISKMPVRGLTPDEKKTLENILKGMDLL